MSAGVPRQKKWGGGLLLEQDKIQKAKMHRGMKNQGVYTEYLVHSW